MLSKIFILLAGHSSETYSFLADMETVKEEEEEEEVAASIIEVPGCYQFIQGQYGRFQIVLVSRQGISLVLPYLSSLRHRSQRAHDSAARRVLHCLGFVPGCIETLLKLGCMMVQDMTLPLAT